MSDTIQSDVAATEVTPAKQELQGTPQKTAREQALDDLELRHQQQMAAENGYDPVEVFGTDDDIKPADQLAAQLAEPEPEPEQAPKTVKVKIDGVEDAVTPDEIRAYQVGKTADARLKEATRLLQEAEVTRQLLAQQQALVAQQAAQAAAAPKPQEPNPAAHDVVDIDAMSSQFVKAMFEGDDENAKTAFKQAIESIAGRQQAPAAPAPAPTLDIAQITDAVTQHVQQKLTVDSALERNRQAYPELYADPDMEALALAKIQRLQQQEGSEFFAALDTVSRDMAEKFGWGAAAPVGRPVDDATTTSRTAKLDAKKAIDNVAAINTKTTSSEVQPENPSDIIAAMRAARAGG